MKIFNQKDLLFKEESLRDFDEIISSFKFVNGILFQVKFYLKPQEVCDGEWKADISMKLFKNVQRQFARTREPN